MTKFDKNVMCFYFLKKNVQKQLTIEEVEENGVVTEFNIVGAQ